MSPMREAGMPSPVRRPTHSRNPTRIWRLIRNGLPMLHRLVAGV